MRGFDMSLNSLEMLPMLLSRKFVRRCMHDKATEVKLEFEDGSVIWVKSDSELYFSYQPSSYESEYCLKLDKELSGND